MLVDIQLALCWWVVLVEGLASANCVSGWPADSSLLARVQPAAFLLLQPQPVTSGGFPGCGDRRGLPASCLETAVAVATLGPEDKSGLTLPHLTRNNRGNKKDVAEKGNLCNIDSSKEIL